MKAINKKTIKAGFLASKKFVSRAYRGKWFKIGLVTTAVLLVLFLGKSLLVAAFVNGMPVSRLSLIKELEVQGGQKVLDSLIEKSLIFQEARKQKVTVEKSAVDTEIERIETLLKDQNLTLDEALSMRGETRASLIEQIRLQKTVEALLSSKISITDEEIKTYFEKNTDLFDAKAKLEDVKDSVKEQLYQQKLSDAYSSWITELKTKAKILYLLKF
ncbi:hypothetical protein A2V61_00110 [Candidatus Woesebacteria bacterium RBG_19FT_COMBO_47_8]|uniref:SurA N-terminal domain-containing protein n=1 Tax=Candidatus Woesebacteria bacterium RBG_13_46_13 TaxID=1802479 RepID=A0A1F7X487_9BACT|nr:MAG: hypothetical protein A2Y68_03665 [Candidatus Woesebacteria bacterium RBG_13_46_13]OGM17861.1 MAG: hypothetical protein A2V61_00110 [Candidatus Woesebacteria bacterium RBG_19FT_COMBO_47_8]HJX59208.1 SurA N-terminal domain-containing protein [Patescibacteria group bacterium]